jgi:hypothetical protein
MILISARILVLLALVVGDSAANGRLHRRRFLRSLQEANNHDKIINRQMQKDDDATNPRANCPHDSYNVFQCDDPTQQWAIPCDTTSCVWDLTALTPDQPPELCGFITVNDVNAELPDEFKPCALWVIVFGKTSAPTPAPTLPSTLGTCSVETRNASVLMMSSCLFCSTESHKINFLCIHRADAGTRSDVVANCDPRRDTDQSTFHIGPCHCFAERGGTGHNSHNVPRR